MKLLPYLLMPLLFSSCIFYTKDASRAVHPETEDVFDVVYVRTSGVKGSRNVYPIGAGSVPLWCDVKHKDHSVPRMLAVCYAGKRPKVSELMIDQGAPTFPTADKKNASDVLSVQEYLNPFGKEYSFSISILPSDYAEFFIFYFDIYRNFCQRDGIGCCMKGNGQEYVLDLVVEEPEDLQQLYRELNAVVSYIKSGRKGYRDTQVLYGLFSAFINDKCSFNKWYYDAVGVGLISPESFMDIKKWQEFENKTSLVKIRRIDVKLVDYQKITSGEKEWLKSSLKNLEPLILAR